MVDATRQDADAQNSFNDKYLKLGTLQQLYAVFRFLKCVV